MFFKNSLDGTVDANTANLLTINAGGGGTTGLFNAGTLKSTSTGGLTIDGLLTNEGTLSASGGAIDVTGNVQGGGVATISGTGSIELGGSDLDVTSKRGRRAAWFLINRPFSPLM